MRRTHAFLSGGIRCDAWLYTPQPGVPQPDGHQDDAKRPVVVMAHGLGGVKGMRLDAFAERFAAAGYVVLVFDYRHFGASDGEPRQLLSVRRQLEDWAAAIAAARDLPEADPDRVVAWGTSFGGGHVLAVAAGDHRLAAAIAQCPFTDGVASSLAMSPLSAVKVGLLGAADLFRAARRRPPRRVPLVGPAHGSALMTAPDALPGYVALAEGLDHVETEVAARVAFDIMRYAPGRRAARITCPLFVALCEHDSVAPARTAARQVARAPRVQVRLYPIGHFDIYVGTDFERAVADQLAFLEATVPVRAAAATASRA